MTNWRARARLVAFACVTGLVLAGCGGDDDGDGRAGGAGSGEPEGAEEQSPLAEFMGDGVTFSGGGMMVAATSVGDLSEEDQQRMRQVEELVAECMREQGFEYVPVDPTGGGDREDPFAEAFSLPPDEFAREYGYGISTLTPADTADEDQTTDPNQEIRDGLSDSAREQYDRALWGEMAELIEPVEGGGVAISGASPPAGEGERDSGCHGEAGEEVYGEDPMAGPDIGEFDGLFADMDALRQRIESDARVAAATQAWADCLAAAGHSGFATVSEPQDDVMERMMELYGSSTRDEGTPSESRVMNTSADVDEAALRELQDYEISLATADYECQQEHYVDVRREVAFDMEEQFVEEHRAELERYRDAMAEGPVGHAGGVG